MTDTVLTYDLGDDVPLAVEVTAPGGAPATGAVALKVTDPLGATTTVTADSPAPGRWEAVYVPAMPGLHSYRWTGAGTAAAAYADSFSVLDPAEIPVVSLAEVKRHLRITGDRDDEQLRAMIAVATRAGEEHTGRVFGRRTVTERPATAASRIVLDACPLLSIKTITDADGAPITGGYAIEAWDTAMLYRSGGWAGTTITAVVGYASQPATDRQGVLEMVRHLWGTQRGDIRMGSDGVDEWTGGMGYSVPRRVAELWDSNVMVGVR